MGPLPLTKVPLDVKIHEAADFGIYFRQLISYHTDSAERIRAFLFLPKAATAQPAVMCLHQTIAIGKGEPAGLGGSPELHYAKHLAERGFVTLAPDYPSFGEHSYDFEDKSYISGTMKAVHDNVRAIDLLQSMPEVDGERIGCIGHSLGGHYTSVLPLHPKALPCIDRVRWSYLCSYRDAVQDIHSSI
jgi:dienelactone hydrolase